MVLGLFSKKKNPVSELPQFDAGDIVAYPHDGPRSFYGHILPTLEYANSAHYRGMEGYGTRFVYVAMSGQRRCMNCNALRKVTDVAQEIADLRQEIADELRALRDYRKETIDMLQRYL